MGGGSGRGLGDGSGDNGFIIAGYMDLGGDMLSDKIHERGKVSENSQQQEGDQGHPAVMGHTQNPPPLDESATKSEVEPRIEKRPEVVPIPSPEIPKRSSEKIRKTPEKQPVATDKRQNKRATQPSSDKANTTSGSSASMTPDDQALPAKNGAGAGNGNMEGDSHGQGAGGNAVASAIEGGSGASGFGYALNMVDKKPHVLKKGPIPYPESARRNGLTGDVVLRFLLSEKGGLSHLQVIHADPPEVFNNAALTAIQKWQFSPAVKDGKPVPVWVDLPLQFSLR